MKNDHYENNQPLPGIPPWMWFFVLMFSLNLPALFASIYASYETLLFTIESNERLAKVNLQAGRFSVLSYPGYFTENLPGIAIFFGLFTILFPRLRSFFIERKNNLSEPPDKIASIAEIQDFINSSAPDLHMKVNLMRPGLIFVYPNGYRKATAAIFSGFLILWKTDRKAAEAVLLHEIVHYRRGDSLFLGPGSFLENAIKLTLLFYLIFIALPFILGSINQKIGLFDSLGKMSEMQEEINRMNHDLGLIEQPVQGFLPQFINSVFISVFGLFSVTLAFLTRTAASFILPVAAVWAAEFNADYVASENPQYKQALLRELNKKKGKISPWRRLLFRLSHPPDSWRRFFLHHRHSSAFIFLLLIYPLAVFVRFGVLIVWMFLVYQGIGTTSAMAGQTSDFTWENFLRDSAVNVQNALSSQTFEWCLMTALLLSWTFIARPWEKFFTRGSVFFLSGNENTPKPEASGKSTFKYFAAAAAATGAVFLLSFILRK